MAKLKESDKWCPPDDKKTKDYFFGKDGKQTKITYDIEWLLKQYPNDQELGQQVRKLFNQ